MVPLSLGPAERLLPAAPVAARAADAAAPRLARSSAGRGLVFGGFVGMRYPDAVDPALGEHLIRHAAAAGASLQDYLPQLKRLDLREAAAGVMCPSLTVWGAADAHAPNGELLAGALRGAAHVLPGCGHMPMLEAPFAFRRALDGWL